MRFPRELVAVSVFVGAFGGRVDAQTLHLEPRAVTTDVTVGIRVTGLAAGAPVIVRASRRDSAGRVWQSYAGLRADRRGIVDLARAAPVFGSYGGVHPMGLLSSMDLGGDARGRVRPTMVWSDTITTEIAVEVEGRITSRDTLVQAFLAPGVQARAVRERGLVGTLFLPAVRTPRPAILVLGGSEGGLSGEDVAAQLASHGFVSLALAYFAVDSLPPALDEIPLEYFGRAIGFLLDHEAVAGAGVAMLGTSKGAEAALIVAANDRRVKAVVGYAPSSVVWSCICSASRSSWSLEGVGLPNVPAGSDPLYRPPPGVPIRPVVNYEHRLRAADVAAKVAIPVERIAGPILLIAGDDDGLWPSLRMAREVMARRRAHGASRGDTLLAYRGAGHLIGKSHLPAGSTLVGGGRLETGGSPAANAAAQADSWPRVIAFLQRVMSR